MAAGFKAHAYLYQTLRMENAGVVDLSQDEDTTESSQRAPIDTQEPLISEGRGQLTVSCNSQGEHSDAMEVEEVSDDDDEYSTEIADSKCEEDKGTKKGLERKTIREWREEDQGTKKGLKHKAIREWREDDDDPVVTDCQESDTDGMTEDVWVETYTPVHVAMQTQESTITTSLERMDGTRQSRVRRLRRPEEHEEGYSEIDHARVSPIAGEEHDS